MLKASEPGRYEPKWKAVRRRESAALIVDRALFRTKSLTDERDFLTPETKEHIPTPHFGTHTSRQTPVRALTRAAALLSLLVHRMSVLRSHNPQGRCSTHVSERGLSFQSCESHAVQALEKLPVRH